jgi:hypothetical protein
VLWRASGEALLELDGRGQIDDVLQGLRRAGVRTLDLIVVRTSSPSTATTIDVLRQWGTVGSVLTPPGSSVAGATPISDAIALHIGGLAVTVTPDNGRLVVDVARGPPV